VSIPDAPGAAGHPRESGQIVPLVIGYAVILLVLVVVVVDTSTVFLQRRSLAALADGVAVAAASAVDPAAVAAGALDTHQALVLAGDRAAAVASSYLSRAQATDRFTDLRLSDVSVGGDATTVTVRLDARVPLPFVGWVAADHSAGVAVHAAASARSPLLTSAPVRRP